MDYQDCIDLTQAQPDSKPMATQRAAVVKTIARHLGRRTPPELAGIPNLVMRPNAEQPMAGEAGPHGIVNQGRPQFHSADPVLPKPVADAVHTLVMQPLPLAKPSMRLHALVPVAQSEDEP